MTRCVRKSFWAQAAQAYDERSYFSIFLIYFYASVQRNVTCAADIYYYITTGLNTRNVSLLPAYGDDVLQRYGNRRSTSWNLWSWIRMLSEINQAIRDTSSAYPQNDLMVLFGSSKSGKIHAVFLL